MEKISQYVANATSNPITAYDYLDFSNSPDGGLTYDVSKKILVSEFLTYLNSNVANIYNADGTLLGNRLVSGNTFTTTFEEGSILVKPIDNVLNYGYLIADEFGTLKGGFYFENSSSSAAFVLDDSLGQFFYATDGQVSIGGAVAAARVHIKGDGVLPSEIIENSVGYMSFVVLEDGSIGMGTASPTQKLSVVTTGNFGMDIKNGVHTLTILPEGTSGQTEIDTTHVGYHFRSANGNLRLGNTAGQNSLIYIGDAATGLSLSGTVAGTVHLELKSTGVINTPTMPTSPVGLVAGDWWNNLGIVNIV